MIVESTNKKTNLLVQFYVSSDEELDPFIYGINGHATIDYLEDIEKEALEYKEDYFEKGPGDYLFEINERQPEMGTNSEIFYPEGLEFSEIDFKPEIEEEKINLPL